MVKTLTSIQSVRLKCQAFKLKAVATRKSLLTKCLITVPQHLDECETLLPCSGVIENEKYGKPWTRAKADDHFLLEQSLRISNDTPSSPSSVSSVSFLEKYECGNDGKRTSSVIDIATFDLDCDIVPSSNPSSPETVCSSGFDKKTPNILEETFQKEDMTNFTLTEELKIEPLLSNDLEDWHTEEAKNSVTLKTLADKLVEVPVTDPLAVKIGIPYLEKFSCENGEQQPFGELLDKVYGAGIFNESIEKWTTEPSTKMVEEIVTTTTSVAEEVNVTSVISSLLSSVTLPLTTVAVETDLSMKKDLLPTKNELSDIPRLQSPEYGSDIQKHVSFLDINDTVDEKLDQFFDEALLDSPDGISQGKILDCCISLPKCEPVSLSQSKPSTLISAQRKKAIMEECFTYDYVCDEIQTARLPEPKIVDMETGDSCVVAVKDVITVLGLKENEETKSLELDPQQQLVTNLSAVSLDELVSLTYGDEPKVPTEPVEIFKKHTPGCIEETYKTINSDGNFKVAGESGEDKDATAMDSGVERFGKVATTMDSGMERLGKDATPMDSGMEKLGKDTTRKDSGMEKLGKDATLMDSGMEKLGEGFVANNILAADCAKVHLRLKPSDHNGCPFSKDNKNSDLTSFRPFVDNFDPLGDFMALRLKTVKLQRKTVSIHEEQNEPIDEPDVIVQKPCKPKPDGKRGNKHHIVNVMLNDEFQTIVDMLKETADPYIHQLQKSGEISVASCFQSLTPDDILFIVRQREKYINDTGTNGTTDCVYKAEVCLYALSQAADYAFNCCLESVIGFLCAVLEEYAVVQKSILESVLKNLVEKQTEFYQRKYHHPKVVSLCKEIETWLRKKRLKSREQEQKILVLVKNATPNLVNCLKDALGCGNLLIPDILASHESEDILQSLDAHNCLIVQHRYVQDTFPWAQFSLVVEFEYTPGSDWQEICQRQRIRHIGFLMYQECVTEKNNGKDWNSKHIDKQICLIGSQRIITSNTELLQLLETRHNILIIERDYSSLPCQGDVFFSDVDVDADSCIVTENLSDLQDDCGLGNIIRRLVVLSLKYTRCFCLLTSTKTSNGYELPGNIITNLSRLKATTANLESKVEDYRVKLIHCTDISEIASVIRCISEECMDEVKTDTYTKQQWLNRSWIRQEITQEEKFLLMIPCMSSYSAQLMLRKMGINQLFKSSLNELKLQFPEISPKIVEAFTSYIKCSRGLQLQSDCDYIDNSQNNNEMLYTNDVNNTEDKTDDKTVHVQPDSTVEPENEQNKKFELNIEHSMIEQESYSLGRHLFPNVNKNQQTDSCMTFSLEKQNEKLPDLELCFDNESPDKNWGTKYNTRIDEPYEKSLELADVGQISNLEKVTSKECSKDITLASKLNQRRQMSVEKPSVFGDNQSQSYMQNDIHVSRYGDQNTNTCSYYQSDSQYNQKETQQERRPFALVSHSENFQTFESLPSFKMLEKVRSFDTQVGIQGNTNNFHLHPTRLSPGNPIVMISGQQKPIETFEYNHGLNSKEEITTNGLPDFAPIMASEQAPNNAHQQAFLERMANFSREFPSSEEIDALVMLQNNNRESLKPLQDHTHMQWQQKVNNPVQNTDEELLTDWNNVTARVPKEIEQSSFEGSSCFLKSGNSGLVNNDSVESIFSFKEPYPLPNKNGEVRNDAFNAKEDSNMLSGRLYLNPNLKRVSLRPSCITPSGDGPSLNSINLRPSYITPRGDGPIEAKRDFNNSLHDDLRETTRRYLENSHQFSKLGSNNSRRNLQRVSIGLAQPQPRKSQHKDINTDTTSDINTVSKESPSAVTRERMLMEQSLWATEDSPPMDLEERNSPVTKPLTNKNLTNREVFTYQTPKKKRKLTYHCVPGRKGQTKLLFT